MMLCELCEMNEGDYVAGTTMCLCEPCREALEITEHETVTGALSDVTLPGVIFPPYGAAQALGISPFQTGQGLGQGIRGALPDVHWPSFHLPTPGDLAKPFEKPVEDFTSMVKTVAIVGCVALVAVLAYSVVKDRRQPKIIAVKAAA